MTSRLAIWFAAAVGLAMSVPLVAHHTASTLYADKLITLKGTVTVWRWSNPHCVLTFEVKGEDGKVTEWLAETQAPNTARTQGYGPSSFKAGDQVTLTVRPAASGQPYGFLTQAVLADGTKVGEEENARSRGPAQ